MYKSNIQCSKIPIIRPGLIFVQKAFLVGLFLGGLIFGGGRGIIIVGSFALQK